MKKTLLSLALVGALVAPLSAAENMDPVNAEFARMNQFFNTLMQENFNTMRLNNMSYPRTDIKDTKNALIIRFDVAGVPKKNIKLTIDDHNVLTLSGEQKKKTEEKSDKNQYVKREIFYGNFQKVMQLPKNIIQSKLTTSYKDGILTVTIPKKAIQKPKAKVIPIQ